MIASRLCPKPTRPSPENQESPASGPRLCIASRVARSSSRSTDAAAAPKAKIPLMPHMRREYTGPVGAPHPRASYALTSHCHPEPAEPRGWLGGGRGRARRRIPRASPQMKTGDSSSRFTAHDLSTAPAVPPSRNDSSVIQSRRRPGGGWVAGGAKRGEGSPAPPRRRRRGILHRASPLTPSPPPPRFRRFGMTVPRRGPLHRQVHSGR